MVRIENLTHRFDDGVLGLDGVNLTFGAGEFVILAGENGAGKTLLMRHVVGLAEPTEGRVLFEGLEIGRQLPGVREAVGLVFQDSGAQIVGLTVGEEVAFGPTNRGWSSARIAQSSQRALEEVGLGGREEQPCGQLSGGELRRLAIAGVLALAPRMIVLDEPFTGLDFSAVQAVLKALVGLHQSGKTVVVLTHELDKCLALATRLVLMSRGRIVGDGTPAGLWEAIPSVRVHRARGDVSRLETMSWLG
ncbi:MAG: ABC transporter ATP-binding protein [Spirochaetales bacterium]